MKIFLDDLRNPPDNTWTVARNVEQFQKIYDYRTEILEEVSLDHDLGDWNGNGHDALVFLEEMMELNHVKHPPRIHIHNSNPSARDKMRRAVIRISERCEDRRQDRA